MAFSPAAEQSGRNRDMHLVHEAGRQILPDGGRAAKESDVLRSGGRPSAIQRGVNAVGHEVEHRAAFHLQRCSWMMREHERRCVIRGIRSPPPTPGLIRPRPAYRAEHIAAEDERADVRHPLLGERIVRAERTAVASRHLHKESRASQPLVQFLTALTERRLERLVRPGAVPVERDRKAVNEEARHRSA